MKESYHSTLPKVGFYNPRPVPLDWMGGGPRKLLADFYKFSKSRFWWGVDFIDKESTMSTDGKNISLVLLFARSVGYYFGLPGLRIRERFRFKEDLLRNKSIFVFSDIASLAIKGYAGKLIASFHGVGPEFHQQRDIRAPAERPIATIALLPRLFLYYLSILAADKIAFPSLGSVSNFRAILPFQLKNIFDKKLVVLPNGIPEPKVYKSHMDNSIDWEHSIIVPGRIVYSKGQDLLMQAILDLYSNDKIPKDRIKFIIIGQGELLPKLRELAGNLGSIIEFIPFLKHEALIAAMQRCMGVVITHRKSVFDLVLLEAMALGKPILTTDIPGNNEMFQNGTALLAKAECSSIANKLSLLISNANLRNKIGNKARKRWQCHYTHKSMADRYERLGISLLKRT
jgi:glycosyltransferase involved in cell wall biosynthesis